MRSGVGDARRRGVGDAPRSGASDAPRRGAGDARRSGVSSEPVAINARAAVRREVGGVERWARELAQRLPELRPERYRVVAPPAAFAHAAGQVWEQAVLPIVARRARLILSPANLAPLTSGRNVIVIHDAAPLRGPEWYGRVYGAWHRMLLPRLVRRARLVVVPSAFVAGELRDLLGVPAERLRVVAPGVSVPAVEAPRPERPYVLAVGSDVVRKNVALLDRIAPALAREGLDVVVAGSGRSYMRGEPGGRRVGYVSEEQLGALYAGAAVFATPSLYEGFGLPCIEAMAAGTPVVAANRAALPETCGDAALLVDPDDPDAFADAILRAARESEPLVAAGRARAAQFSWERSAAAIDAALGELLADL
jgi:glycosyltransferase involved in cell wall biosynthesis